MAKMLDEFFKSFQAMPEEEQKRIVRLGANADFVIRMLSNNTEGDNEVVKTTKVILEALTREY